MNQRRWSIFRSTIEIVTIVSASVAAIAAVWQGYMTSKALRQPFQSNLQSQQISACSELIYQADEFLGSASSFLAAFRREPPFASDGAKYESSLKQGAIENSGALSAAIKRLKFFADDPTKENLKSLSSAMTAYLVGAFPASSENPWTPANEAPWRKQFSTALEMITLDCDNILIAERVGKL